MKKLLKNIEKTILDNFKVTGEITYICLIEDSITIKICERDLFSDFKDRKFVEHAKQISEKISEKYSDVIVRKAIIAPSCKSLKYEFGETDYREILIEVDTSKLEKLAHDEYILIE